MALIAFMTVFPNGTITLLLSQTNAFPTIFKTSAIIFNSGVNGLNRTTIVFISGAKMDQQSVLFVPIHRIMV